MKRVLIVTFDIFRGDEPQQSLAVGYLIAYLKAHANVLSDFVAHDLSVGISDIASVCINKVAELIMSKHDSYRYDCIAIGAYVWSECFINPLIDKLKGYGFRGVIVLGGYQVSFLSDLISKYPGVDCFIPGYAEESLRFVLEDDFCLDKIYENKIIERQFDFKDIQSPYLNGIMKVRNNQGMVRLETKRGCPFSCSFCAHKDLRHGKVYYHDVDVVTDELRLMNEMNVNKINIIDPTFNFGPTYMDVLRRVAEIGMDPVISLQSRFERIVGREGEDYLELCSRLNVILEFGLQSTQDVILKLLNRSNDLRLVKNVMNAVICYGIKHEISLIYGVPGQTLSMFEDSIAFLEKIGCRKIVAHPLKLIRGTYLWEMRDKFKFKERDEEPFNIPIVVESDTFNESEWEMMHQLAVKISSMGT